MRKIILTSIILLGGLFFGTSVHATVQQPIYDTSSANLTGSQFISREQNFIALPLETPTSTITSITIRMKSDNTCGTVLKLRNNAGGTLNSKNVTTTGGVEANYTFEWTSNPSFHTGNLSWFVPDTGNSMGGCTLTADHSGYIYGSANTSTYTNGYWEAVGTTTPANAFFIINSTTTADWIAFDYTPPATNDFFYWATVSYITGPEQVGWSDWSVRIIWSVFPSSLTEADVQNFLANEDISFFSPTNTFILNQSQVTQIAKGRLIEPNTVIYAQANLFNNNGVRVAQSAVWNFAITTGSLGNFAGQNGTSTAYTPYGGSLIFNNPVYASTTGNCSNACQPYNTGSWLNVPYGVCQGVCTMFKPSEYTLASIVLLKDNFSTRVPFGYFSVYADAIGNALGSATSTTSTLFSQDTNLDNELTAVSGFYIINLVNSYLFVPLLWFLFGLYLYHRIKNFNF